MYKENLLKKISSYRNKIDNVTFTHFDLNLTSAFSTFQCPSGYYSDHTLQLNI